MTRPTRLSPTIQACAAAIVVVAVAVTGVTLREIGQLRERVATLAAREFALAESALEMEINLNEVGYKVTTLSAVDRPGLREEIDKDIAEFRAALARFQALAYDDKHREESLRLG